MIFEIVQLKINPSQSTEFEAAVKKSAPVFQSAKGCHGMRLEHVIEDPAQYRLIVKWETVDDHMVHFRESPAFQTWRANAGPFFTEPPIVHHSATVETYF